MDSKKPGKNKLGLALQEMVLPEANKKKKVMTVILDKKTGITDQDRGEEFMCGINDSKKYTTRQTGIKEDKYKITIYEIKK